MKLWNWPYFAFPLMFYIRLMCIVNGTEEMRMFKLLHSLYIRVIFINCEISFKLNVCKKLTNWSIWMSILVKTSKSCDATGRCRLTKDWLKSIVLNSRVIYQCTLEKGLFKITLGVCSIVCKKGCLKPFSCHTNAVLYNKCTFLFC